VEEVQGGNEVENRGIESEEKKIWKIVTRINQKTGGRRAPKIIKRKDGKLITDPPYIMEDLWSHLPRKKDPSMSEARHERMNITKEMIEQYVKECREDRKEGELGGEDTLYEFVNKSYIEDTMERERGREKERGGAREREKKSGPNAFLQITNLTIVGCESSAHLMSMGGGEGEGESGADEDEDDEDDEDEEAEAANGGVGDGIGPRADKAAEDDGDEEDKEDEEAAEGEEDAEDEEEEDAIGEAGGNWVAMREGVRRGGDNEGLEAGSGWEAMRQVVREQGGVEEDCRGGMGAAGGNWATSGGGPAAGGNWVVMGGGDEAIPAQKSKLNGGWEPGCCICK
jgi:hypothetical protein